MSTAAQRIANLANAQHSTGPVTDAGKEVSSRNALRHGLYAKSPTITGESAAEFAALRDELLDEIRPRTAEHLLLCEQLLDAVWRSRRIERLETAWFNRNPEPDLDDPRVFRVFAEFGRQHARCQRLITQLLTRLTQLRIADLASFPTLRPTVLPPQPPPPDPRTLGRPKPKISPIVVPPADGLAPRA